MDYQKIANNGVNETGTKGEGLSPGRCLMAQQHEPGRHQATARRIRRKWSQEDNRIVMECYYRSEPGRIGYRKRMHNIWTSKDMFPVTEQRLIDQKSQIIKKQWLSNLELEEIKQSIEDAVYGQIEQEVEYENRSEELSDYVTSCGHEVPDGNNDYFYAIEEVNDEERDLIKRLNEINKRERTRLPSLRGIEKGKLYAAVNKIDIVMGKVKLSNITETNNLIYCGAALVTETLGINRNSKRKRQEPWWKRRLEGQIRDLNRDLGRVNALFEKKAVKKKESDELQRKHKLKQKGLQIVKEELKQRIKAKSGKIARYNQRIKQYQQNRQFKNNEAGFYKRLSNEGIQSESEVPERNQAKQFWTDLWSTDIVHNRKAKWLEDFKMKMNVERGQGEVNITREKILKILEKVPNWKAPGPDGVQGFWLKRFKSIHQYLEKYLAECLKGQTPTWMTKGRTVLIQKDKSKGRDASNYRPITCLPLCWKLLTALLSDEIYLFLEENQCLPEEQKGCRRKSRGTGDQLYIDKMILREVKVRKKSLAMGWIDYRKAFDMMPHSWILECLNILGVNHTVVTFLEKTMKD